MGRARIRRAWRWHGRSVGRDPEADLFFKDAEVSRRHAYLQLIAGRLFCVDLQSRTGTRWGDEPGLWGWIQQGTKVGIGPFRLHHRDVTPEGSFAGKSGESPLPVPVTRSFVQPELPEATLEILGEPDGPSAWRVSRALVLIAGSQACKVRLPGGGIADIHAGLLRTPSGVFAVDFMGPGGILVNGERVRWARLGEDDEITVGNYRLRVRCGRVGAPAGRLHAPRGRNSPGISGTSLQPGGFGTGVIQAPPAFGEDTASLVRSMIDEFGQAQMQMADRFQETLMVVLQSFAGIHGEQMALIREEMARIRELTEEQQALRSRTEGQGSVAAKPPVLHLVTGETGAMPDGPPLSAAPTVRKSGPGQAPPDLTMKGGTGRARADEPTSSGDDPPRSLAPEPKEIDDLHTRIFTRLAEIQDERQGRWQKLLKTLLG